MVFAQSMSLGPGSQLSHLSRMHDMTQVLRHLCADIVVLVEEQNLSPPSDVCWFDVIEVGTFWAPKTRSET